jgi:bacterial/archaeal transporter family-2 protein
VDRGAAVALTTVAGGFIALQAPINSVLGKSVGTLPGAFVNFLVGTIALAALVATVGGGFSDVPEARNLSWYYLTGGLLGALYVTCALITVRHLGAGGVTAATIAGQLTASIVIDQLGLLGVAKDPINASKIAGVVFLSMGVYLIVRE